MNIHDKAVKNMIQESQLSAIRPTIARRCEICGCATESADKFICLNCINQIRELIKDRGVE